VEAAVTDDLHDHVLGVRVRSLDSGRMTVQVRWRDQPTAEQRADGVECTYGVFDRMVVAAWMEAVLTEALRERKG
jgi:hypothetical protein